MNDVNTGRPAPGAEEPAPGWRVWRSDRGRWWAVRVRGHGGMTLDDDDEDGLLAQMADIAERDRSRAA